jgi:hypothetical protein
MYQAVYHHVKYHAGKAYDHLEEVGSNHSHHVSGNPALSILRQPAYHPKCPLMKMKHPGISITLPGI